MRRLLPRFAAVILAAGAVMALSVAAMAIPATMLDHVGSGEPEPLELGPLAQRSYVYAADGQLMATLQDEENRQPVPLAEVPPHASMGFNQTWIFLTDVLPRAIKKHGGFDPEALRKAALETDIPEGGTIQGYGVKFFPPGHQMSGQNERSSPVVMQYVDGKTKIAWPAALRTVDPVLPFPKGHAYAR